MFKRMLSRIALITSAVIAWYVFFGFTTGSTAGALQALLPGLVLSAALAVAFVLQTLVGSA